MATTLSFLQAHARAGRGFIIVRPQYRHGDRVQVTESGEIGSFADYITDGPACGRVRVFVRGRLLVLDQDQVEHAVPDAVARVTA